MEPTNQNAGLVDPKLLRSKKFRLHQVYVFLITTGLYAALHSSRSAWAYSQKSVENDTYFTDRDLSILNTAFMISYAFGLFYSGWLGDHSFLKGFLARGAFIAILGFLTFTILVRAEFHNMFVYTGLFVLNGYGQSREFPGIMAVLGNWIEKAHRGLVIGVWNSCVNVGNIMGQQIAKFVIDINGEHWSIVLFITAGCITVMVLILLIFLKVTPKDAGFSNPDQQPSESAIQEAVPRSLEHEIDTNEIVLSRAVAADTALAAEVPKGIGFFEALKSPGIIRYGLIFACLKGSTYGLLFWLPNYLQTVIGFGSESANITACYEVGQVFGAILLGHCSDRLGKRAIVIAIGLYLSSMIFLCLTTLGSSSSAWTFGLLLFFIGFLFGGPEELIGNIVSSDIGESKSLEENARALATTVGIMDGIGAVGAAIVQLIIPHMKSNSFVLYFSLCIIAALSTTPIAIKEMRARKDAKEDNRKLIEMAGVNGAERS